MSEALEKLTLIGPAAALPMVPRWSFRYPAAGMASVPLEIPFAT
jgi:hypothetical protein